VDALELCPSGTTRRRWPSIPRAINAAVIALALCLFAVSTAWACSLLGNAVSLSLGPYMGGGTSAELEWDDPYAASGNDVYAIGYNSQGQISYASTVNQSATPAGYGGQGFVIPAGTDISGGVEIEAYQHTGAGTLRAGGAGTSSCGGAPGGD
jgi:hypothetical protein